MRIIKTHIIQHSGGLDKLRMDYERIQEQVRKMGPFVHDFLAMHRNNDPYYVGSEKNRRDGAWFAENWQRFGFTRGIHVRRMHYALVSASPAVTMPKGQPYINTLKCYQFLDDASTSARYLDYVDPALFVDRRNEKPMIYLDFSTQLDYSVRIETSYTSEPDDEIYLPYLPYHKLDTFNSPQRYHLEIWCEKSTMNDIMEPLAQRYKAAFVYGKGELSITQAFEAIQRFKNMNKPVRIFYVSDFDPSGRDMPVNMIRKVEYFLDKFDLLNDLDIRMFPVALTPEQVRHYAQMQPPLLTTPLKDDNTRSMSRAKEFYEKYGVTGGVELDALETVHPGELERILKKELDRYYDHGLDLRVFQAKRKAEGRISEANDAIKERHREDIGKLEKWEDEINKLYNEHLSPLLRRYFETFHTVSDTIQQELEDEEPDVSEDDIPEAAYADEREGALFDSSRAYMEQIDRYKQYKGNETDEELIA